MMKGFFATTLLLLPPTSAAVLTKSEITVTTHPANADRFLFTPPLDDINYSAYEVYSNAVFTATYPSNVVEVNWSWDHSLTDNSDLNWWHSYGSDCDKAVDPIDCYEEGHFTEASTSHQTGGPEKVNGYNQNVFCVQAHNHNYWTVRT